ncbi:nucleoside-triphosphatase [Streptomyces sp. NPDC048483]|uniref:nucleoside-triphosphatase n=1 Tax=Streptomyces sp. NPDC048483 TaxID=3154927 RepID=UPI003439CD07
MRAAGACSGLERATRDALTSRLTRIDELGWRELAWAAFQEAVSFLFETDVDVVATVHAHHAPFADALKRRADIELVQLTRASRGAVPGELAVQLESC